jgi:DNA topoisomerase-1
MTVTEPDPEPAEVAAAAGLTYASDDAPGYERRPQGRGFTYVAPDGARADEETRRWIEELAIPPAWTDVWISLDRDAHILATGRDDAGRKQYRYHDRWRSVRDAMKFERLSTFGVTLPGLREELAGHLRGRRLTRDRVLAGVVRLLDVTLIRIGNEEYAADNDTYGATTLRRDHVRRSGHGILLEYPAKGGVDVSVPVADPALVRLIEDCASERAEDLFCYRVDGQRRDVTSDDVNDFLRERAGDRFSAKDFRTWGATTHATEHLGTTGPAATETDLSAAELAAIDLAAERLGNTRAVARACYVAPQIPSAHRSGLLHDLWRASRRGQWLSRPERTSAKVLQELLPPEVE